MSGGTGVIGELTQRCRDLPGRVDDATHEAIVENIRRVFSFRGVEIEVMELSTERQGTSADTRLGDHPSAWRRAAAPLRTA